jgi:hypothetical protein
LKLIILEYINYKVLEMPPKKGAKAGAAKKGAAKGKYF